MKNLKGLMFQKTHWYTLEIFDELSQIMRSVAYEYQLMKEGHEEVTRCYMEIFFVKACKTAKVYRQKSPVLLLTGTAALCSSEHTYTQCLRTSQT